MLVKHRQSGKIGNMPDDQFDPRHFEQQAQQPGTYGTPTQPGGMPGGMPGGIPGAMPGGMPGGMPRGNGMQDINSLLSDPKIMQMLMMKDLSANKGKNISSLNSIFSMGKTSVSQQKASKAAASAAPTIRGLIAETARLGNTGAFPAAISSLAGRFLPFEGGPAEELDVQGLALAKQIANLFQAGDQRATDEDIKRWLGLMPRAKDTPNERKSRLKKLINQFNLELQTNGMSGDYPLFIMEDEKGNVYSADSFDEYWEGVETGGFKPYSD